MRSKLASRKLWVAILTALLMLTTQLTGHELKPEQWLPILIPLVGWIFGEAWVDASAAGTPAPPAPGP